MCECTRWGFNVICVLCFCSDRLTNFQQQQQQQQSGPGRPTLRDSGSSSRTTYVFEVFSGETAILPCPAPPSDPPATLTFFKDNKPISESGTKQNKIERKQTWIGFVLLNKINAFSSSFCDRSSEADGFWQSAYYRRDSDGSRPLHVYSSKSHNGRADWWTANS